MAHAAREEVLRAEARGRLGEEIRLRRNEIDLSQAEVGQLAGVHRVTIRAVETGKAVEDKTLANVKRAIGCAPSVNYRTRDESRLQIDSLRPVLSISATRILATAVLRMSEESIAVGTSDYFDLINALSETPPDLPQTLHRFLDSLQNLVPPAEMQLVDREIQQTVTGYEPSIADITESPFDMIYGRTDQRQIPMTKRLPDSLVGAIVQSGLPEQFHQMLLSAMMSRQAELRARAAAQLQVEASAVMKVTYEALALASGVQGQRMNDPGVIRAAERALSAAIDALFKMYDSGGLSHPGRSSVSASVSTGWSVGTD